jgi:cation transport regulator ChaB
MPYKIDNPPEVIKGLPKDAQAIWIEIYNNAFKQYEGNDKQEELANQTAWAGLKKAGWEKNEDDKWIKKNTFAELHDIEVFAVGTWNNTKITEKDIDDIVNGTNEIIDKVKPFVKLGHDDKQKLLQNSGLPAGGWITRLKRKGQKILVDIADVPQKLYELISKGAYKRISSEILWDYTEPSTKRKYNKVLSAIAFLGADLPAVTNLEDIAALYSDANKDAQIILYEDEQNKKKVNDKNIKKGSEWIMPNGIKVQELEGKKFVALEDYEAIELEKAEADKMKKDYEEAQAKLKKYEEEQKRLKEEARKKDIEKFVADNCSETTMHFLPKQKDIVMTLMESFDNENKWEFTEGSNTKELTQAELFKMFIELQPNMAVDKFKELSSGGDNNNEPETDLDKINKYAEEHKMTFADAAIALFPNGDYKLDNK